MGYAVYEDPEFPTLRWAGYGVPAECDFPDCHKRIDRGLAYKCETYTEYDFDEETEEETESEAEGCGLYFCPEHEGHDLHGDDVQPKTDLPEWEVWMLTDESWERWRNEEPKAAAKLQERWATLQRENPERAAEVQKFINEERGVDIETE